MVKNFVVSNNSWNLGEFVDWVISSRLHSCVNTRRNYGDGEAFENISFSKMVVTKVATFKGLSAGLPPAIISISTSLMLCFILSCDQVKARVGNYILWPSIGTKQLQCMTLVTAQKTKQKKKYGNNISLQSCIVFGI